MASIDFKTYNKTLPKLRIPASVARFPWVSKPQTRFKPEGVYKVEQVLDPKVETHAKFLTQLEELSDQVQKKLGKAKGAKMNRPYMDLLDENEEPTGKVVVKASTSAKDQDGNDRKLTLVDGAKQPVTDPVYSGSILICGVKPSAYDTGTNSGLKLYLNAVRVVDLVSAGGSADDLYDDDEDDAGYVAGPSTASPDADEGGAGNGADDADY